MGPTCVLRSDARVAQVRWIRVRAAETPARTLGSVSDQRATAIPLPQVRRGAHARAAAAAGRHSPAAPEPEHQGRNE